MHLSYEVYSALITHLQDPFQIGMSRTFVVFGNFGADQIASSRPKLQSTCCGACRNTDCDRSRS